MSDTTMRRPGLTLARWILAGVLGAGVSSFAAPDGQPPNYQPIVPSMSDNSITLTGRDLTIEQVVDVARYGAKVQLSVEATQRQADHYGLLLEAAAEGVAVYWFNRGAGDQRETIMFSGDPMSPKNKAYLERSQLQEFRLGADLRLRTGGHRGRDCACNDGRPRQCDDLRCAQPATLADAGRPLEPSDHPGSAVAGHSWRRRSGTVGRCRCGDGRSGRGLLPGPPHERPPMRWQRRASSRSSRLPPTPMRSPAATPTPRALRHWRSMTRSGRSSGLISSMRWIWTA